MLLLWRFQFADGAFLNQLLFHLPNFAKHDVGIEKASESRNINGSYGMIYTLEQVIVTLLLK
ncbi:MAG: hypothetical protein ACKO1F_16285 [Flammeovirgaceae bacterium]